jgi:hypothetical protein
MVKVNWRKWICDMNEFKYWQVRACFGVAQVTQVLADSKWHDVYPSVFQNLESDDARTRYDTLIPTAILREIASSKPYLYAFGAQGNMLKCRPHPEDLPPNFRFLSPLEALEEFGGELLLEAVDYGTAISNPSNLP